MPLCCSFYCIDHGLDRAVTGVEFLWCEEEYVSAGRLGYDNRCLAVGRNANVGGLVVAVVGVEGRRQLSLADLPLGALPDGAMRNVAQRAMSPTKPSTDPVGEFTAQGAIGVVDPDEPHDPLDRCRVGGGHRDSIADRAATALTVRPVVDAVPKAMAIEILVEATRGGSMQQMAKALGIAPKTVAWHLQWI